MDELKGTFPELKESLDERYAAAAAPDDTALMDWFITNAQPHFLAITTKSEALFKENDATFLLPDINFTQLWKCKLTKATKAAIWKYLHVMLLLVSHYQLNTHDFESTFAQWNEMLDGNKGGQMDEAELHKMKAHAEHIMQLMQSLAGGDEDDAEAGSDDEGAGGHAAGGAEGADDGATPTERAQRFEKELKEDHHPQLENSKSPSSPRSCRKKLTSVRWACAGRQSRVVPGRLSRRTHSGCWASSSRWATKSRPS